MKKISSFGLLIGIVVIIMYFSISTVEASNLGSGKSTTYKVMDIPWYDPAWNYRRPVVINNNGGSLLYYQVLVRLDNSNFNFNLANSNGSDVRFTHSDGTTELQYWVESWNSTNHIAYLWVRVPGLAAGATTIYMYYNNPQATAVSNGKTTFDGFDEDWSQFTGGLADHMENYQHYIPSGVIETPLNWEVINLTPTVTNGIINLVQNSGIKSTSTYRYDQNGIAMGMRANFGLGLGNEWGGFVNGAGGKYALIGDLSTDPDDLYLRDYRTGPEDIPIPRANGNDWHNAFHVYEIRWESSQVKADVDHGTSSVSSNQPLQVPDIYLPISVNNLMGSNTTMKVDWAYVRQYRNPEPISSVGVAQGLVDLQIQISDSPDPLPKNVELTYQITVTNNSVINAPGVIVTDTLPVSVQFTSANPSQGSCSGTNEITCILGTINSQSTAGITINVKPQSDGVIINTVITDSPGFELNENNNVSETATLVDSVPPLVNWEAPVHTGGTYYSSGGLETLEASAIDDKDQVAWVEFKFWDHNAAPPHWVVIGRDYTYPYQVEFDTSILVQNQAYQTFAYAMDRAGNQSDPYDPLQRIFLVRRNRIYLPIALK
jgi:uncharacterized repeat protein (TIGR01451 family)